MDAMQQTLFVNQIGESFSSHDDRNPTVDQQRMKECKDILAITLPTQAQQDLTGIVIPREVEQKLHSSRIECETFVDANSRDLSDVSGLEIGIILVAAVVFTSIGGLTIAKT